MNQHDRLLTEEQKMEILGDVWYGEYGLSIKARQARINQALQAQDLNTLRKLHHLIEPKLAEISSLVSDIRGDWTDPRHECREIWRVSKEIDEALRRTC